MLVYRRVSSVLCFLQPLYVQTNPNVDDPKFKPKKVLRLRLANTQNLGEVKHLASAADADRIFAPQRNPPAYRLEDNLPSGKLT